jgi:hypothetical protein
LLLQANENAEAPWCDGQALMYNHQKSTALWFFQTIIDVKKIIPVVTDKIVK